jgi:hypothetical protein
MHLEIMTTSKDDLNLYNRLIRRQRQTNIGGAEHMMFDGQMVKGEDLPQAWASYFETLATPVDNPQFGTDHCDSVLRQNMLALAVYNKNTPDAAEILTPEFVEGIINKLKVGKAPDIFGLSGEHLRFSHHDLYCILTHIFNSTLADHAIPQQLYLRSV